MGSLETSSAKNDFASIVDAEGQWMDGEISVRDDQFVIIIDRPLATVDEPKPSLTIKLSQSLTKKISNSSKFGFKTSVVEEFVAHVAGRLIVESLYIDRVDDKSPEGRIAVKIKLEDVTPQLLERILDYILETVFAETTLIESPVSSSFGIADRLRRLFSWR